ncbi:MAG: Ig-like domain-containing protein [Candidatus Roizmanbacteria bacterium]|nr:Ig-like domain-containing protein [Candidatus Roizmanbacteria bacterium]
MKRLIILIGIFIVILIILIVSLVLRRSYEEPSVSPTPTLPAGVDPLRVISTVPKDNSENIPVTQQIVLSFNEPINLSDITILVSPETPYTTSIENNVLTIFPDPGWQESTAYRIAIRYPDPNKLPDTIDLITEGGGEITFPDTAPDPTSVAESEKFVLNERPDIFLKNKTPYAEESFSIISDYDSETQKFTFLVEIPEGVTENDGKAATEEWMVLQGLTSSVINSLSIEYIIASPAQR